MIKIGYFSKLSRISVRMLRHYNEIGLLIPDSVDDFTGYRYYSEAQLPLANRIGALKEMGFTLAAITEILKEYDNPDALRKFLSLKYKEVKEQSENVNRQMLLLESAINRLRKDERTMEYSVILKEMPQRSVASLRKIIPSYQDERILWEQFMKETAHLNLQYGNPKGAVAVFHDEGYKESDVDVEIQVPVDGSYSNTENVVFKSTEPTLVASATYKGSYEQIIDVNEAVANWVTDNNYEFDGAMFCIYHVSPAMDDNPENWVTEVCYPVRGK
jgi:DNA-binding transcriptional MerR regulator